MSAAFSRRRFLKYATAAGAAIGVPQWVPGRALGKDGAVAPSERITLAGIGVGNRGAEVLSRFLLNADVQMVADADLQRSRRERVKQMVDKHYGNTDCVLYRNMEEVLQRDDVDAVLITTGDRWHTLASLLAAKAGKDIYCEKPCSMTIEESRMLADGIARSGRVYQAGTQRRSIENFQLAARLAHSGKLGELKEVHANILAPLTQNSWLPAEPEPPREECDWNGWLGPCPWRPYNSLYVAGGWQAFPTSTAAASSNGDRTPSICASLRPAPTIRRRSSSGPTTTTSASITPTGGRRWRPRRRTSSTAGMATASSW